MRIFVTADLHFNHKNILTPKRNDKGRLVHPGRPFTSKEEMNEALIQNWNNRVTPEDAVFVLGDVSFGGTYETIDLCSRLNGIKVLVMGNHDRKWTKTFCKRCGFDFVFKHYFVFYTHANMKSGQYLKVFLTHEPMKMVYAVDEVANGELWIHYESRYTETVESENWKKHEDYYFVRYRENGRDRGWNMVRVNDSQRLLNIHGHIHGLELGSKAHRCVSVENTEYSPMELSGMYYLKSPEEFRLWIILHSGCTGF